jgi:hypothetical protein
MKAVVHKFLSFFWGWVWWWCWGGIECELRALWFLGRCSTTWTIPLAIFAFSYFSNRVLCFSWINLDCDFPVYTSSIAGILALCHHVQLIGWDEALLTFHRAYLEPCIRKWYGLLVGVAELMEWQFSMNFPLLFLA